MRAWLSATRVDDTRVAARVLKSVVPEPFAAGEGVRATLERADREAAAFDAACAAGAPPAAPPAALLDKGFAEELACRARWHFRLRRRALGGSLAAATKAPRARWAWMGLVVCSFLRSYVGWVRGSIVGLVALALCGQLVAFTVAHDASHNALSTNRLVNVLGCYGILCVTSPHEWTLQHVLGHHLYPNVAGEDPDVIHVDRYKARMLPAWLPKWCDVLLVWSVAVPVGLTTLAPLRVLLRGVYPGSSVPAGLDGKVVVHVLGRLLHLGAFFAWPFFSKDYSLAGAAAWVFAPAALGSLVFMAVTQIAHLLEETLGEQTPTATFYATQIANSCNFATDSAVVALLTGGLNQQVEHHAFPTVHHAHLPALAPIVKATCDAHGVPYHEAPSMTAGLAKHLDYLEALERRAKGGAPAKPSTLLVFEGTVAHARRRIASEPDHAFKVRRHAMWLLPLDDGDAMAPLTSGWLLSWRPGDHLRSLKRALASPADVADAVRELCARRGGETPGAVKLLCMPRHLGYTFNPIAVYYVYGAKSGDLSHVVFEVSNTPWLEETLYVHAVAPNGAYGPDEKQMHVSPFQPMGQAYDWLAPPPSAAKGLRLAVKVSRAGDRYFDATFDAEAKAPPASLAARLRAALGATPQVAVLLIHVHAAALLAKGARFYPHPSGVKTPFSRAVEVLFHGKLWLLLLSLGRACGSPAVVLVAALGFARRAAATLGQPSGKGPPGGGAPPAADARGLSAALAYARGKLGAVEVTEYDDDARRVAPSAADVDAVLAACAEKAPRFAADPSARGWAARSLVTHHGNVLKAARVCANLAKFRDANGWAYRLDGDAAALEKELRSGMHWVLPGHDVLGRRVVVYNARALLERHDIEKLQKMLCLLLERLLLDEGTMRRGVIVVADCRGATASMARRFRLKDVTRGSEMLADAFPCRLRGLYLVGLPGVLKPLVYLVKTFMTKKQRDRIHVSTKELLAAVDRRELPASLGGDDASFDWDAIVDRLLDARPADPPHAWLDDRRPALMVG